MPPEVFVARRLRRSMSLPEVLLWQHLRHRQGGVRFRRQHPTGPYVVDFYAPKAKLAIEIDGAMHDGTVSADRCRDAYIRSAGIRVVRIPAPDVLRAPEDIAVSVVALASAPLHRPAGGPPPRSGEDQE